jgi:hypothetical protein
VTRELLFYKASDGEIATARLETNGTFTGLKSGGVNPNWTHIVTAGRELLFYKASDGEIATARLEADGIFTGLKSGGVNPNWTHITATR